MRDSIVFYKSFFDSIQYLPDENKLPVLMAVLEYGFTGNEQELEGVEKAIFSLIKPQLDANEKRYQDGKKGGRPKREKPVVTEKETSGYEKEKPVVIKNEENKKPNVNVNVNDNVNDNKKESIEKSSRFLPPTLKDVKDYCIEKGYKNIDADRFIDFYSSKGWMVGKNKMKDWKAAVRNWTRSQRQESTAKAKTKFNNFEERDYDMTDLESKLFQ